jgi:glycosyltransferase involved in cell wall biosynthesis
MAEPLVSIVVPVCNGESSIGQALDSALGQTYRNLEIIVVDDGSRDRTSEVVDGFSRRDGRVRLVAQPNRGVAAARNRALAETSGELVAPLDADDLWDPSKIARQVRRMREAGADTGLVYCWWVWIDGDAGVLDSSPRWRIEGDVADTLLAVNFTGNASVPLFRRRALVEAGGYDEGLRAQGAEGCEDWDVALKIAERALVAVEPARLVAYRRRRGAMSTRTAEMWRSHELLVRGAERRRRVSARAVRRSHDQFALHLAGVSFWSGRAGRAVAGALRARRSTLPLRVLRFVPRVLIDGAFRNGRHRIQPGASFAALEMPEPLIPYDRIYDADADAGRRGRG